MKQLVIRGYRVVLPGSTTPAAIRLHNGKIAKVTAYEDVPAECEITEAGDTFVLPGLVDTHVHLNEPGRTHWEGFESGTRKALAGGVTTLIEMPLNSIPATTTLAGFQAKLAAAQGKCHVAVGFWGGVVPGNARELEPLWDAGVFGFKCFLVPSGVDEFPHVTEADLREAMPVLARLEAPLLVHAELGSAAIQSDGLRYESYLRSRPKEMEHAAIEMIIRLCREFGTHVHIVHLSSADAAPALRQAKKEGLPLTVETCPHYLTCCAEEIPDGATHLKCAPPIRGRENRERLWEALRDGVIDMVVSDHSPCPSDMKVPDFFKAWGGISSLGTTLQTVWRQAMQRGFQPPDVARWMAGAPARLARLTKGEIAVGYDADLIAWDGERLTYLNNASNSASSRILTRKARALSSFEPGSAPATT